MKEGSRLIIYGLILMLSGGLMVFSSYRRMGTEKENKELTKKLKEKQLRIDELESEVEIMEDEISEREIEIKFWGMKYDSIKQK